MRRPSLDDDIELSPATCIEDAMQIVTLAEAPMTVAGLLNRLQGRWSRATAASAVQTLLAARRIEWATVGDRQDCVQVIGWSPPETPAGRLAIVRRPGHSIAKYTSKKYLASEKRKREIQSLLSSPRSIKDCAAMLGMGASRVKHYVRELRHEGLAVAVGELDREGRGRGEFLYINPQIARGA